MKYNCPVISVNKDVIELAHGGGGKSSSKLIDEIFKANFDNEYLNQCHDGAVFSLESGKYAYTTDSYVVTPLFFPGGNIGDLAVNGTINDLLCCGAFPQFLSCGFVIEEGFPIDNLKAIVKSMSNATRKAGTLIVTGDTKVVERGKCDGIYINTSGIGLIRENINLSPFNVVPGDMIIITGYIGNHGMTIMSLRNELKFTSNLKSDTAALTQLVHSLLRRVPETKVLRDATRGGLAAVLNEIANTAHVTINIDESSIPIHESVEMACRILGISALNVANEGVMIAIVPRAKIKDALDAIRNSEYGENAHVIGEVIEPSDGIVTITMPLGEKRRVEYCSGILLPRIC